MGHLLFSKFVDFQNANTDFFLKVNFQVFVVALIWSLGALVTCAFIASG
ncbi:MAG: hypothetical protein P1R58_08945 [bacterium]|nr:hypothetical protein [bacterium]